MYKRRTFCFNWHCNQPHNFAYQPILVFLCFFLCIACYSFRQETQSVSVRSHVSVSAFYLKSTFKTAQHRAWYAKHLSNIWKEKEKLRKVNKTGGESRESAKKHIDVESLLLSHPPQNVRKTHQSHLNKNPKQGWLVRQRALRDPDLSSSLVWIP